MTITLTTTETGAKVLNTVLSHVGGWPEGPRGYIDALLEQLYDAGIKYDDSIIDTDLTGAIVLTDSFTTTEGA